MPPATPLPSLTQYWTDEHFWVPRHQTRGFPLLKLVDEEDVRRYAAIFSERGLMYRIARNRTELHDCIFRCVTIYCGPNLSGVIAFNPKVSVDMELVLWLCDPWPLGDTHSDAYSKFVHCPLGLTEDVWGKLGAWAWADLEDLLANSVTVSRDLDETKWLHFTRMLEAEDRGRALEAFDSIVPRGNTHKQRHYIDIISLYFVCAKVWATQGQGRLFKQIALHTLYAAFRGPAGYERIYLTSFWLWTTPYWQNLCRFFLTNGLYKYDVDEYRAICKEITARVTASWFFPLSNIQTIASAYFLNAEDLTGFADNQESTGQISYEVLEFALAEFEYTFPGSEGRDFESYLHQFKQGVESMLRPLYREFADKARSYDDLLKVRTSWGAGGVAGRRARDVLGKDKAPPGSAKAYVMTKNRASDFKMDWGITRNEVANKMDERGPPRTITATDMRDQVAETFVFQHFSNRYPRIGLDIGESPVQAMVRHCKLVGNTIGRQHYMRDGRLITAWDWMKWDHFYHNAEKVMVLQVMRELTARYIRHEVRGEMLAELDDLIGKHHQMVYRSQAYADEEYGRRVDELLAKYPGKAKRLDGREGETSILVVEPNGQQSGRKTTLEGNTIVGTARLLVRDAELLGKTAHLKHRTALYVLNRADDVAEIHATYERGVAAINKMLEQGHRANPKKQVAQWRSVVYLRILYAGGAMRAFPPRAVYAAATGHPNKGAGAETAFYDKLRSCSKGLDMWVRRGGWMRMARAIYDDVEHFFSRTRVWYDTGGKRRAHVIRIAKDVLHAAPEHGGLGILPPGEYEYDYSLKCSTIKRFSDIAKYWSDRLQHRARTAMGPGIHDLEAAASDWLGQTTGIKPSKENVRRYKQKWAQSRVHQDGDGTSRLYARWSQIARCVKRVHRDVRDTKYDFTDADEALTRGQLALDAVIRESGRRPEATDLEEWLRPVRGLPAEHMIEHLWHGYGQVIMAEARSQGLAATLDAVVKLASASQLGRDFLAISKTWSINFRADHLTGNLGPAGAWDKLIPPSWAGWVAGVVSLGIAMELAYNVSISYDVYATLKLRAHLTKLAAVTFVSNYPLLCLH